MLVVGDDRLGLGGKHPEEQIVNVLEVVVEGLAVDLAVLYNILYGNIVQGTLLEQLFSGTPPARVWWSEP